MDTIISQPSQLTPTTNLKSNDISKPSVAINIDDHSFKKFVPTGIKVRVNVPVQRANNRAFLLLILMVSFHNLI